MFGSRRVVGVLSSVALLAVAALVIHGVAWASNVPLETGGSLTKTSWESEKADTGGATGAASSNTYTVTFATNFAFKDVHWTVEGPDAKPLPADANNKGTGFRVKQGGTTKGSSTGGTATSGSVDADCAAGDVTIEIDVTTTSAQIRLHLTFTTKDSIGQSMVMANLINLDATSDDARPIYSGSMGVNLSVRNMTPDPLTFGHYSIVGASWPAIDSVTIDGAMESFIVVVAPDGKSFSFSGGILAPAATMQIQIVFDDETPGLGAVIGGLRAN